MAAGRTTLDARADAYGHSLRLVAPVARSAGVRRVIVTDDTDAAVTALAGYGPDDLVVGRFPTPVPFDSAVADSVAPDSVVGDPWGLGPAAARPVMTLIAEVIAVKHVGTGAGVSYGYTYRTTAPTTLALVGLGYADGVPRLASNRATVLIEGFELPIVGRIAMDQFVVDCAGGTPTLGAEVVLFGSPDGAPTAAAWAAATERPATHLTAGLGRRILRIATHAR
ncbi:alanine racemase [uncultured Amnibacterium sp.]|uniref:alanine racemase n=1 Tax=uncultured Amnibacterium sp. TaxID=1631851 RepID=UPI0035CB8DFB